MKDEEFSVRLDTSEAEAALARLERLSERFGERLTGSLARAVINRRSLDDVLRRIGMSLANMALRNALKPLEGLGGSLFSSLFSLFRRILPFEKGGVPGRVTPFAAGGVVAAPTYFSMGREVGLMGEAGAEAILPLARGADGRLGVAGGGAAPVNVVFNVTTPDAASFRKSEAQVTGMIARAARRGARTF